MEDLRRVRRPGGRLLLVFQSLVLGLARLAEQRRWAQLADVPSADVVLVTGPDGSITPCCWPDQLEDLLAQGGLEVEWVRPRTVLTPAHVERALAGACRHALDALAASEVGLASRRQGESNGLFLAASARRSS